MQCANCGKSIERGNYVNGVALCAKCVLEQDEDEQFPRPKRLEADWLRFATTKRRRREWR